MLASTLKGIISQRLVPTSDEVGRAAVTEVLCSTSRVQEMIADPKMTHQLTEAIHEGEYYGMRTFDQSLLELLGAGRVSMDDALRAASNTNDFKLAAGAVMAPAAPALNGAAA
jgi:Tfp pilus assembly ATPase PilU